MSRVDKRRVDRYRVDRYRVEQSSAGQIVARILGANPRSLTRSINSRVALVLCLVFFSLTAAALPTDREQPIYVAADKASIDDATGVTVYLGDVEISQGSMVLKGDRVELYRDEQGNVSRVLSLGEPAYFEQQPQLDQAITYATGAQLDYDVSGQILVIIEDARVEQGGDEFTGARIRYDMNKSFVEAFSDQQQNQRVRMVIQPRGDTGS